MDLSVLRLLRLKGYCPATMLDIGANVGDFTRDFLEVFPETVPTLVEPNPYCHERLETLPFEVVRAAASSTNGTAEIFLTTEWLTSTGASLFRENTAFFRDEVVAKEVVETRRIDDLFFGRKFDFVKIDVQGGEYDVLTGGAQVIGQADYVLVELSVVEYNAGGAPAEVVYRKMAEMGFHCRDLVQFHRLRGVADGGLLQIDVLFERNVTRATQNHRLAGLDDVGPVLDHLRAEKAACPDFSVIDIGSASAAWAADLVDARFARESEGPFRGDPGSVDDWSPLLRHVAKHGKFSYSLCRHALPGLANPGMVMAMLPQIAEAGFISVPSQYAELLRHEGPYRGFVQHRWIFCVRGRALTLVPKIPLVEFLRLHEEDTWRERGDRMELQIHWRKGLSYLVLNDDRPGPNAGAVIEMYSELLN